MFKTPGTRPVIRSPVWFKSCATATVTPTNLKTSQSIAACAKVETAAITFFCYFILITLFPHSGLAQLPSASSIINSNSPFVRHLFAPPWIKRVDYLLSVHSFSEEMPSGRIHEAWQMMSSEAALQPSGMFIEELTPNAFAKKRVLEERHVVGIDDKYYWIGDSAAKQILLGPVRTERGGSSSNSTQRALNLRMRELNSIRYLGLPPVREGSFSLRGIDEFSALGLDGSEIEGQITSATNGQPLTLTYRGSVGINRGSVNYKYRSGTAKLPDYFEVELTIPGKPAVRYTNQIQAIEWGLNETIDAGYSPSQFFTNLASFKNALYWSNGVRYAVATNGALVKTDNKEPVYPQEEERRHLITAAILVGFLVSGGLILWKIMQKKM